MQFQYNKTSAKGLQFHFLSYKLTKHRIPVFPSHAKFDNG